MRVQERFLLTLAFLALVCAGVGAILCWAVIGVFS